MRFKAGSANDEPAAVPAVLAHRRAGVLLHPTSLPSGTLDTDALRFMDWLQSGGFTVWQMLPLGPVGLNGSPYSPDSAFAGNFELVPRGNRVAGINASALVRFRQDAAHWLGDYVLFRAIREELPGLPWWDWPVALRQREPQSLRRFAANHAAALTRIEREQFLFDRCWREFSEQARQQEILLFGDLPMFVTADSADVWAHPELFRLDQQGRPTHVAGVPPDAFTALGQCWDSPVYDWEQMLAEDFEWWRQRLAHECQRFDLVRWDHFRGLEATFEIPVAPDREANSASTGAWRAVPGKELLQNLTEALGALPVVAENLGTITPEVEQLRMAFGLPGMHVLQFAFDGSADNPHLPAHHQEQGVVYTGTHDNDTTLGWWTALCADAREEVLAVLGTAEKQMPQVLIQAALASRCRLAVVPMQDVLALGSVARMNLPGEAQGQWGWRFSWDQLGLWNMKTWQEALAASGRR